MAVQTGEDGLSGRYIVCRLTKAGHIACVRLQQSGVLPPACFEMLALLSFLNTICIFIMIRFILMIIMI